MVSTKLMKFELFTDSAVFETIDADKWNGMLKSAATDVIFLTWEWQSLWWRHINPGEMLVLAFSDGEQGPQALVPLFRSSAEDGSQVLSIIGCEEISDYLDVIAPSRYEDAVCSQFLAFITSSEAPHWDRIQLCNLPRNSTAVRVLAHHAQKAGFHVETRVQARCPSIELPKSWDEYLAGLDKKQRHELRRKIRKAEAQAASWRVSDPASHDLASDMASFVRLHRLSDPDKNLFMDEAMTAFFLDMAQAISQRGWLHLSFLEQESEQIAGLLSFDYNNHFQVYNSGYDASRYSAISPGIVLIGYCIRHAIELQRHTFDFLRGEEEYKYRLGARPTDIYELTIQRNGA